MMELGKFIQEQRLAKAFDLDDISHHLKIKKEFILAIEQGRDDYFSSKAYYYGYLKQYLKLLQINDINLNTAKVAKEQAMSITLPALESFNPNFLFMVLSLFLTILIYNLCSSFVTKNPISPIALELTKKTSQFVQLQ